MARVEGKQLAAGRLGIVQPARRLLGIGALEQLLERRRLRAGARRGVRGTVQCVGRMCRGRHGLNRTKDCFSREIRDMRHFAPKLYTGIHQMP
jgi:hypothetical protein